MPNLTPLMKQYREIKNRHPEAILFFRVGDFYEMFFEDAISASKILEIALTSRDKSKENAVPLCGIPYHAASNYVAKLIRAGQSVAICDQVEDPSQAKGLVRREVVRVITPGTLIEPELLKAGENHYLVSVTIHKRQSGLALVDLSTGEFRATQFNGSSATQDILSELARLAPKELLVAESDVGHLDPYIKQMNPPPRLCRLPNSAFNLELGGKVLLDHFQVHSMAGFGCEAIPLGFTAAGALLKYLQDTQIRMIGHLNRITPYFQKDFLVLDANAQKNLELVGRLKDGQRDGSLLWVLDQTVTPMGARLLRRWLLHPLLDISLIQARQSGVGVFLNDTPLRNRLRTSLKGIADMERITGRVSLGTASGRDLIQLMNSLNQLPGRGATW